MEMGARGVLICRTSLVKSCLSVCLPACLLLGPVLDLQTLFHINARQLTLSKALSAA